MSIQCVIHFVVVVFLVLTGVFLPWQSQHVHAMALTSVHVNDHIHVNRAHGHGHECACGTCSSEAEHPNSVPHWCHESPHSHTVQVVLASTLFRRFCDIDLKATLVAVLPGPFTSKLVESCHLSWRLPPSIGLPNHFASHPTVVLLI